MFFRIKSRGIYGGVGVGKTWESHSWWGCYQYPQDDESEVSQNGLHDFLRD
jgi:hypothetical protein